MKLLTNVEQTAHERDDDDDDDDGSDASSAGHSTLCRSPRDGTAAGASGGQHDHHQATSCRQHPAAAADQSIPAPTHGITGRPAAQPTASFHPPSAGLVHRCAAVSMQSYRPAYPRTPAAAARI